MSLTERIVTVIAENWMLVMVSTPIVAYCLKSAAQAKANIKLRFRQVLMPSFLGALFSVLAWQLMQRVMDWLKGVTEHSNESLNLFVLFAGWCALWCAFEALGIYLGLRMRKSELLSVDKKTYRTVIVTSLVKSFFVVFTLVVLYFFWAVLDGV